MEAEPSGWRSDTKHCLRTPRDRLAMSYVETRQGFKD